MTVTDLPKCLRDTFKAWGMRTLGDDAADEIERLREEVVQLKQDILQLDGMLDDALRSACDAE